MYMDNKEYRSRREALGLSQRTLGQKLGITRLAVLNRENGRARITPEHEMALDWLEAVAMQRVACKALEHE